MGANFWISVFFLIFVREKNWFFFTVTKKSTYSTVVHSMMKTEIFFIRRRCRLIEFNLLFGVNDNDDEQTNKINFNVTNWLIVKLVGWLKWIFFITIKQNTDDDDVQVDVLIIYIHWLYVNKNFFFSSSTSKMNPRKK